MATVLKSKISPKSLGNPRSGASLKANEKLRLGRIFGVANGVKRGTDATGMGYAGLKGSFEAVPADADSDTTQAGVCFLPPGITEKLIAELDNTPEGESPNLGFAFDIYVRPSTSAIGYEYETVPVMKPATSDILSAIRGEIENYEKSQATAALEDKSKAKK